MATNSNEALDQSSIDWWLVSTDDRKTVRVGAHETMVRAGLQMQPNRRTPVPFMMAPNCWLEGNNAVIFPGQNGEVRNLWQLIVSPATGEVEHMPERLTTGSGNEVAPSCALTETCPSQTLKPKATPG